MYGHIEIDLFHPMRHSYWWNWGARNIRDGHYLRCMPDGRTSMELFIARCDGTPVGALTFGRPEATRCADWYGSVEDVAAGRCEVTRWQILNLSRVWIDPNFQAGGQNCRTGVVPGYIDRKGNFRSTLASRIILEALGSIGFHYLRLRPPCFLDEPYEVAWVLSYCDTSLHRGTIYREAGFELYRTNKRCIQTWRRRLDGLQPEWDEDIRAIAEANPRSIHYRAQRAQLSFPVAGMSA